MVPCVEYAFNKHITHVQLHVLWTLEHIDPKAVLRQTVRVILAMEVKSLSLELEPQESLHSDKLAVVLLGLHDELKHADIRRLRRMDPRRRESSGGEKADGVSAHEV